MEPAKKRGRKRVYNAEKTRETIMNAALKIFSEHGYSGSSVDSIAGEAGYNKSLIFQYFINKQGLYTEVLRRFDTEFSDLFAMKVRPVFEDDDIFRDAHRFESFLKALIEAILDYMIDRPAIMKMINWEQADGWQTIAKISSRFEPTDFVRIEAAFSRAKQNGLIRPSINMTLIFLLIEQICWSAPTFFPYYHLFLGKESSPPVTIMHFKDQIIAFLLAGIINNPGKSL